MGDREERPVREGAGAADGAAPEPERAWVRVLGSVATVLAVLMYVSYIPQIANNLDGRPGSPVQPFVAFVACSLWALYGFSRRDRDWPLVVANSPGIVLGLVTFLTALAAR